MSSLLISDIINIIDDLLDDELKDEYEDKVKRILDWIKIKKSKYGAWVTVKDNATRGMIANVLLEQYSDLGLKSYKLRDQLKKSIMIILSRLKEILINIFLFVQKKMDDYPKQNWDIIFDSSYIIIRNNQNQYKWALTEDKSYSYILMDSLSGMIVDCEVDHTGCVTPQSLKQFKNTMWCD